MDAPVLFPVWISLSCRLSPAHCSVNPRSITVLRPPKLPEPAEPANNYCMRTTNPAVTSHQQSCRPANRMF